MANGQQKAQQNLEAFELWVATQTDDDFKQIIHRGQLNRGELAKAIGCGKSALNQNPSLKQALKSLEDGLRERGVLPSLTESAKTETDKPKQYDSSHKKKQLENNRIAALEAENLELKAKLAEKTGELERYSELGDALSELGIFPR
jgi:hypothetical protein